MLITRTHRLIALSLLAAVCALPLHACNRRGSTLDPRGGDPALPGATIESASGADPATPTAPTKRPPSGTTCGGRDDCPSDQVCVDGTCRYRETSVAGEILAASATALVEAGDWEGAIRTYDDAMQAYNDAHAPVPADLLCHSASILLSTSTDAEGRERGARRADQCFRSSLPGYPAREDVRRAVARLRFEGLDVALFDRAEPAERFFTGDVSRPTIDALAIDIQVPEGEDAAALAPLRTALATDSARRAIAECFVQDWEVRHEREARASLVVRFATHLRDMGTYDVYEPELTFEQTTVSQDGFEPCVAGALQTAITFPRGARTVAWQTTVDIDAHVQ
jgi:hypothetical protein